MTTPKATCPEFKGMTTNPDCCARWHRPEFSKDRTGQATFTPFCRLGLDCRTSGLRLVPRADQESDSENYGN